MILIDKPAGMTSFGVVARIRRKLSETAGKKVKVGHTGTLDPFATGLLILMTGKRTKDCEKFLKLDKEYIATLCLGKVSTTGDPEGIISDFQGCPTPTGVGLSEVSPVTTGANERPLKTEIIPPSDQSAIQKILNLSFYGRQFQKVPAFSAVKINGKRAYKLAREGKTFETPTREIEIYNLEILEYNYPTLKLKCHVSSGTYIRTLAEDIGQKLGTGAYLTALRRTKIGDYDLKDVKTLEDFGIEWYNKKHDNKRE